MRGIGGGESWMGVGGGSSLTDVFMKVISHRETGMGREC